MNKPEDDVSRSIALDVLNKDADEARRANAEVALILTGFLYSWFLSCEAVIWISRPRSLITDLDYCST